MSISAPLIKWSINFRDLNFHNIIILDILVTFLTTKKEEYFIRVEITGISKTVKNPQSGEFSLLNPLRTVRKSTTNKVPISDYTFNFVSAVSTSFVPL